MRALVLYSSVLFAALYYYPANYWRSCWFDKWAIVMAIATLSIVEEVRKKFHWSLALALGYTMLSALWVFAWRDSYPSLEIQALLSLGKISAYAYSALLAVSVAFLFASVKDLERLINIFSIVCGLNALVTIVQFFYHVPQDQLGGLFGNPSISACFTAFTYPLLNARDSFAARVKHPLLLFLVIAIPLVGVALPGSSQPMGVLAVCLSAFVLKAIKNPKADLWVVIPLIIVIVAGCLGLNQWMTHKPEGIFMASGRFGIWRLVMGSWWSAGHTWIGQGTGTTQILVPLLQYGHRIMTHDTASRYDMWLWLHSDYLQALFENGILGFASIMVMVGYSLKFAWAKPAWLFSSLCGVLATALFNFPAHFPLHAFFTAFILCAVFHRSFLKERQW